MTRKMTKFMWRNGNLGYFKQNKLVKDPSNYRVKDNRVYKAGRLVGYINTPKEPKMRNTEFTINKKGQLAYAKTGRKVPQKFKYTMTKSGLVYGKKNGHSFVVGINRKVFDNYIPSTTYAPSFEPPELSREPRMPSDYDPMQADRSVNFRDFAETLAPMKGLWNQVVGPGVVSIEQQSMINFSNALKSAVDAGFIEEADAQRYFNYYKNSNNKSRADLWNELEAYFEDLGYDYFE